MNWSAKSQKRYSTILKIDATSIALHGHRKGKLNIYSPHYLDEANPAHEQSELDEAGALYEPVFKSKDILLLNFNEQDPIGPYERMLFNTWGNKIQTLCLQATPCSAS